MTGDGPPLFYEARFIISGEDEILAIIRNITDRVRAEQEMKAARQAAENASRSKSDFLANMSHEIRTPLNSITGFIGLLKKTQMNPGQDEYLDIIDRSAENLVGIINDILDFSKIESGKIEIESIDFNPFHEFEPTIEVFTERAQKKNIALYSFLDPSLPPLVKGDPLRIKQVLINLLSNAIKFTPDGGKFSSRSRAPRRRPACRHPLLGPRHRDRHSRTETETDIRGVFTGRQLRDTALRGQRTGPEYQQQPDNPHGKHADA